MEGGGVNAVAQDGLAGLSEVVEVNESSVMLHAFEERDAHVVAYVQQAGNPQAAVHDCLALGARAMAAAVTSADSAVVERAFSDMTLSFSRGIESFASDIDAAARGLLDGEDGDLARCLRDYREELERLLSGTFDPDSNTSALARLDDVMRRAARDQVQAIRALIDPDNAESPLCRYRGEIVATIEKESAEVRKQVDELRMHVAVTTATETALNQSAAKGFGFEEKLGRMLSDIVSPHEDVVERVGGIAGASGKKGDFTVTLNPVDTAGRRMCYVVEAKDRSLKLRDARRDLDEAMANRDAAAAIVVFARAEHSPCSAPFQPYGNHAVVVFDKDEQNDLALRLSCAWARWVTRRQVADAGENMDLAAIASQIDVARAALRMHSTVSTSLKASKTKIDQALGHVGTLVSDVETALAAIEAELSPPA
jgi:hypothetical protein